MDYEKIIVELLSRIQTLEEKVASLTDQQETPKEKVGEKMTTENIRQYILQLKDEEIAKQFNISQQSVRTYIMRARRKAYALFKEDMENE